MHPWRVVALVLAFSLLKVATLAVLARPMAVAPAQRWLFAFVLSQGGEFGFVVFAAAAAGHVITAQSASLLTLVAALSMMITPVLMVLHDKVIAPRAARLRTAPDEPIEMQDNPVILAGFGRVGQIVGRLLASQGIGVTVLERDPDQVTLVREFGYKVFYGDAARMDLLEAAGAATARIMVVAVDDMDDSLALVDRVREHFPHLQLYCRARNVTHVYQLMDRQVHVIEREAFEGSLRLGRAVLEGLGRDAYEARAATMTFRRHNIAAIDRVYPHYRNRKKLISLAREGREELEQMFDHDRSNQAAPKGDGWA